MKIQWSQDSFHCHTELDRQQTQTIISSTLLRCENNSRNFRQNSQDAIQFIGQLTNLTTLKVFFMVEIGRTGPVIKKNILNTLKI